MKKVQTPSLFIPDFDVSDQEKALLIPGIYSGVFNCPIHVSDLYKTSLNQKMSGVEFQSILVQLSERFPDKVKIESDYVTFAPATQSIEKRIQSFKNNDAYLKENKRVLWLLGKIPFVKYAYFSGGTAHANHTVEKDIDLFIVTSDQRVWISYTILRVLHKFIPAFGDLCLNYVVDESALEIFYQRDFYTAHQIVYLKPINSVSEHCDVKSYNSWIFEFFPNLTIMPKQKVAKPFGKWNPLTWINIILMSLWINNLHNKNYKNNIGGVLLDSHRIKLHSNDHRPKIYQRFMNAMKSYKISEPKPELLGVIE